MAPEEQLNIFWFRRDLRLTDNKGLFHALASGLPVLGLFIFDKYILDKLEDKDDARVTFIYDALFKLDQELKKAGSGLLIEYNTPEKVFADLLHTFPVKTIFTNHDYEPYARERDERIASLVNEKGATFLTFKDHVIFERNDVVKENGLPYTVYSPYKRKWLEKLRTDLHLKTYPSEQHLNNFQKVKRFDFPPLEGIGFIRTSIDFPEKDYENVIEDYAKTRDFPHMEGTSKVSVHLRFGTISIRELVKKAVAVHDKTWLNELIWREFYMMVLWHFPDTVNSSFRKEFDKIQWRNNEDEFNAWCEGRTGYPIVDAGMRQLNETGWMHNRVRMIVASFLTKHLLIDWRWGEAYFARKLLDYEQASNVGGWQWAAGSGTDAVPYFRIFNPEIQAKKFDGNLDYVRKYISEFDDPFVYPAPIVDHRFARERALKVYKNALNE